MSTDWLWPVAIVLACFGWVTAMTDRKGNEMEEKDERVRPLVIARPDMILQELGFICDDESYRSLLCKTFDDFNDKNILLIPAFAYVSGLAIRDEDGGVYLNFLQVSGADLVTLLYAWRDVAFIDFDLKVFVTKHVLRIDDYLVKHRIEYRTTKTQFDGYNHRIELPCRRHSERYYDGSA